MMDSSDSPFSPEPYYQAPINGDNLANQAAFGLCALSPYSYTEAQRIVQAIIACRPVDEIVPLLTCSPGHRNDP